MAIYRVGDEGAVVFNADGKPLATLRPGCVVVPGTLKVPGSHATVYLGRHGKRVRPAEDKRIKPAEDKGR